MNGASSKRKAGALPLAGLLLCLGLLLGSRALAEELPSFFIRTQSGAAIESDETYVYCYAGTGDWQMAPAQIRGRGNTTWLRSEKKSYRLKFVQKQNPFGIGHKRERDWVLLANHFDKSLLRNYTALLLASRLNGLDASIGTQNVQLYLNGEYMGVYLLCERIEPNSCGIAVNEARGGFLLEIDTYAAYGEDEDAFMVYDKTYTVHSDYAGREQLDEISFFMDDLDSAISGEDEDYIREYLDIDSWIDAYLVEEFIMNRDVGFSSFYLYRPDADSRLFAGPLWDFDLSSGNDTLTYGGDHEGFYACELYGEVSDHPWFAWLMGTEWFSDAACARWVEISPIVEEVLLEVQALAERYEDDFQRNFQRWPVLSEKLMTEPAAVLALSSHREHAEYLINWLRLRKGWLDTAFADRVREFDEYH